MGEMIHFAVHKHLLVPLGNAKCFLVPQGAITPLIVVTPYGAKAPQGAFTP